MSSYSLIPIPARIVDPADWIGYIPFAFWLVNTIKPAVIVELGTNSGNAYFAFCQNVKENQHQAKCYAVNNWPDSELFEELSSYNDQHYQSFSVLLRKSFDEALSHFSNHSIDLLHIDSAEPYETIKSLFEAWLPKLSNRGVILIHNITFRNHSSGIAKLWEELSKRYPHLKLNNSCGLGVLFIEPGKYPGLSNLISSWKSKNELQNPQALFAQAGHTIELEYSTNQLKHALNMRDIKISQLEVTIQFIEKESTALRAELYKITNTWNWKINKFLGKTGNSIKKRLKRLRRYTGMSAQNGHTVDFGITQYDPFVSIICVNYNGGNQLSSLFESLLMQTYNNYECIIVDNNSIDHSDQTIRAYETRFNHFKYVKSDKNLGFAEGNNYGFEHAHGEYIALINNDTKVDQEWLRELVNTLKIDGKCAAATSKTLFWETFQDITITSNVDFNLDKKALLNSLAYQKYFIRSGKSEHTLIASKNKTLSISLPASSNAVQLIINATTSSGNATITIGNNNVTTQSIPFAITLNFSQYTTSENKYIINNAGSKADADMRPVDRGLGEYDTGQYNTPASIPYFCGCSVLLRRAAFLERKMFVSEFFAYYEDSELSRWLTQSGCSITYNPKAIVYHKHASTSTEGSTLSKILWKRNNAIFCSGNHLAQIKESLSSIGTSYHNIKDSTLITTLRDYDNSLLERLDKTQQLHEQTTAIGIYNSSWTFLGGGESHALSLASALQNRGPIYLIADSNFNIHDIENYFSINLSNCRKLVIDNFNSTYTKYFDLFINADHRSTLKSFAKTSLYIVNFPHKHMSRDVLTSYYFLFNSKYTKKWALKFWGNNVKGDILYPIRMLQYKTEEKINTHKKERILLSVGRFFAGGHCKNQLEIVKIFKQIIADHPETKEWKLILAGSLDMSDIHNTMYYQQVIEASKESNIEILPNVSRKELDTLFAKSSLYIHAAGMGQSESMHPENFEHFGITVLEAMLSGCIPIVYYCGGPAEITSTVGHGYTFKSPSTMYNVIEQEFNKFDRSNALFVSESRAIATKTRSFVVHECSKDIPFTNLPV